jgi:hypothetical protein
MSGVWRKPPGPRILGSELFEGTAMSALVRRLLPLTLMVFVACSDSPRGPLDPALPPLDLSLGRLAFEQECSGCHASRDGFDLKTFGFADTTIIRRAVKHVDSSTARNIAGYIASLSAPRNDENVRLFQPRGTVLSSDLEFANALFGRDAWPAEITSAQLVTIDPRNVQVAIKLPVWSDEKSNTDWMPDFPLPPGVLDYSGGLVAGAVAGYRAAPTRDNLVRAVNALRTAERAVANADAPCLLEDTVRVRYRECFEVRRWASTLVALYMLKWGMNQNLGGTVHDIWWDVGNAARKSRADRNAPIANAVDNWATWMYLGWSFDPSRHSSSYLGGAFRTLGMTRHATFVALRSQVARPRNSISIYEDALNAVKFAPNTWASAAGTFALRHLNERIAAGERPANPEQTTTAIMQVNSTLAEAFKKVPLSDRPALDALARTVLASLGQ